MVEPTDDIEREAEQLVEQVELRGPGGLRLIRQKAGPAQLCVNDVCFTPTVDQGETDALLTLLGKLGIEFEKAPPAPPG